MAHRLRFYSANPIPTLLLWRGAISTPFIAQTFFHRRLAGLCHGRPHRLGPKYALLSPTLCSSLSSGTKRRLRLPFGSPLLHRATCVLPSPACLRIPPHRTLFAKRYISRKPLSCIFRSYEVTLYMDTQFFPPPLLVLLLLSSFENENSLVSLSLPPTLPSPSPSPLFGSSPSCKFCSNTFFPISPGFVLSMFACNH